MLTNLTIRNFKCFGEVSVDLASPVVFIGPNNSGKTTALQALSFWNVGIKRWLEKRGMQKPEKRPGVAVNRRDLMAVPVPNTKLLWKSLHVRDTKKIHGKPDIQNVRIEIIVEGVRNNKAWKCGLEFDYANDESFYCRPLRLSKGKNPKRMPIPVEVEDIDIAFLPTMSGLSANETVLVPGALDVRIGEGRTAEVLRNLCHKIHSKDEQKWQELKSRLNDFFGVIIEDPQLIRERGEIVMSYIENDITLDLSSAGRGLHQILLLLSYMYSNPGAVLLLDEPDAHLEILRQRQMYRFIVEAALNNGNQIIAASHSEVLLNEAAGKDTVVAFVGKPHRIADRGSQVLKALREIGFEHYYQAEQTGWVLYLEGSTDLAILQTFAEVLESGKDFQFLERPYVHYIGNEPKKAADHFYGLREAVPHLKGIAIFDRLSRELPGDPNLTCLMWEKCEIENYLCFPETLEEFARFEGESESIGPLFSKPEVEKRLIIMKECIKEVEKAMETLGKGSPWDANTKVSDDFLTPLFKKYYNRLNLPNTMPKSNFHRLTRFVPREKIDLEIKEKLRAIVDVARSAKPAEVIT